MKIVLVSYSGTSASILKDRMSAWATANMIEVEIVISSLSGLDEGKEDADIVLVGPQVRCALASVRERVPVTIPVLAVDTRDFGMAKGDRVMKEAIAKIESYRTDQYENCHGLRFFSIVICCRKKAGDFYFSRTFSVLVTILG